MVYVHEVNENISDMRMSGYGTEDFLKYHHDVQEGMTDKLIAEAVKEIRAAESALESSKEVAALVAALNKREDIRNAERYEIATMNSERMSTHNEMTVNDDLRAYYLRYRRCTNRVYAYQDVIRKDFTVDYSVFSIKPEKRKNHNGIYGDEFGHTIARQERKRFKDLASAEKYLEGRFKAYSHLFKEEFPEVPAEFADDYMINGKLLPGYRVAPEKED